jgi:hypothetical protein
VNFRWLRFIAFALASEPYESLHYRYWNHPLTPRPSIGAVPPPGLVLCVQCDGCMRASQTIDELLREEGWQTPASGPNVHLCPSCIEKGVVPPAKREVA